MANTPTAAGVRVAPELLAAARAKLGIDESAPLAHVLRAALAKAAGVDPALYELRRGPKRPAQREGNAA